MIDERYQAAVDAVKQLVVRGPSISRGFCSRWSAGRGGLLRTRPGQKQGPPRIQKGTGDRPSSSRLMFTMATVCIWPGLFSMTTISPASRNALMPLLTVDRSSP